jgi:hypothetical protein
MKYREGINTLIALAVEPVILLSAGAQTFCGGTEY